MNIVLAYAVNEIGVTEIPGPESNARINEYLKTVGKPGDDEIPWCAAFVGHVLEKAGIKSTRSPLARSYTTWGKELKSPELGCIAVLRRGKYKWQGHVGFYLNKADRAGTHFYMISGNDDNTVKVGVFPESKVITYRQIPGHQKPEHIYDYTDYVIPQPWGEF